MSWVDQCKIAFKTSADALRWKKKKAIDEIIKAMSRESNIPIQTLRFWYYETEVGKTTLTCKSCGERPVLIRAKTIKPYGPKSKFYGLCSTCKSKKEKEN